MKVANPNVIRDFMICKGHRLPNAARHRGVKPAVASVIREHWIRRIAGRCVRCGYYVKGDKCPKCNTSAPSSISFLDSLSPNMELLRVECQKCHEAMIFTAGEVLNVVKRRGSFNMKRLCGACRREKNQRARAQEEGKKVSRWEGHPTTVKSKKTRAPKSQRSLNLVGAFQRRDGSLRQMPFLALKGLKIEK